MIAGIYFDDILMILMIFGSGDLLRVFCGSAQVCEQFLVQKLTQA